MRFGKSSTLPDEVGEQTYEDFLKAKAITAPLDGFSIQPVDVNPLLKPHQRDVVSWAIRGGRRAIFAAFGLGKSFIQLEIARLVLRAIGGRFLIVLPLGVRQEFIRDASKLGITVTFVRRIEECEESGIYLTNYETIRDGKLDPRLFSGASLDEAACLRGFGGTKVFREFMRLFDGMRYKFVATATPSPNDFIELLAYSAFLEVMDVGEAKTRFFKRNSEKADELTIHPHKKREFFLWCASWGIFIQRPSDLGYADEGYELPGLDIHWHEIPSTYEQQTHEVDGQGRLVKGQAIGIVEASREKRESLDARIAKLMEIRAIDPAAHRIIWHDLEAERRAIEEAIPSREYSHWVEFKDGNADAIAMYERHYSARKLRPGRKRELFIGPGEKTVLLTKEKDALFAWRKFKDDSGQTGVNCAVFRNEGDTLSSILIREACEIAWQRWPGEKLYTYVDAKEIESTNPGYCFLRAGWLKSGVTKGGLIILQAQPPLWDSGPSVSSTFKSVYGSQDMDEREAAIIDFSDGKITELATKPVIAGSGCNFQRHCSWAIYLGIGFKFNDFIQSIHRILRFLQTKRVRIDLIYTEAEREVRRVLEEKWEKHKELMAEMTAIIKEFGLAEASLQSALRRSIGVDRIEVSGDGWILANNDAVYEAKRVDDHSIDLILTSIPFSTQYEYTPSFMDFGHTDNNEHFWKQMDFLTPELLRALKPGRLAAIHVKDRIVPGGLTGLGFQVAYPFHADCIRHFQQHGFAYLGMKTIVTDVVRENNQTYRLGWSEQCKDGSKMSFGMPEYLLLFRKPPSSSDKSYADEPVVKSKPECINEVGERVPFDPDLPINPGTGYSRSRWQIDAHGFARSSGNRTLLPSELQNLKHDQIFRLFRDYSAHTVYDYEHHVQLCESLEGEMRLPVTFMLLQPQSWHTDIWSDITRMLSLNSAQSAAGRESHLCPLQFDTVDRAITQWTQPGELVYDPFAGLGTVPYRAVLKGRRGRGSELNPRYFFDSVQYLKAAEQKVSMPSLFDALKEEATEQVA